MQRRRSGSTRLCTSTTTQGLKLLVRAPLTEPTEVDPRIAEIEIDHDDDEGDDEPMSRRKRSQISQSSHSRFPATTRMSSLARLLAEHEAKSENMCNTLWSL